MKINSKFLKVSFSKILFFLMLNASALPWSNKEGKTIEAEFVRIEGKNLVIKNTISVYKIPLETLSKDSQSFAYFMQESRQKWAIANADSPIITEQILQEVISHNPELTANKSYLVEGHVAKISKVGSALAKTPSTKVQATLNGGTNIEIDFIGKVSGKQTKMLVEADQVVLLSATTTEYDEYIRKGILLKVGQKILITAIVKNGKIIGNGLATPAEETEARLLMAKQNGGITIEQATEFEQIKIRIEFLEASLNGNAGTATIGGDGNVTRHVTYHYSDAEKNAMRKELELLRAQISAASKP